jgi:hypothetical protein
MMKKNILLVSFLLSTLSFAAQVPVTVMPKTMFRISYGDSSLELNLTRYNNANSFQVQYVQSPTCPVAPQTALQVRYEGNESWYNTTVEQGMFKHSGFKLAAIKILFRQLRYASVDCEMLVTGLDNQI